MIVLRPDGHKCPEMGPSLPRSRERPASAFLSFGFDATIRMESVPTVPLKSGGLRPTAPRPRADEWCSDGALKSEGLRLDLLPRQVGDTRFQRCPEIRGIETPARPAVQLLRRFRRCPEIRGIESPAARRTVLSWLGSNGALKSEGLRLSVVIEEPFAVFRQRPEIRGIETRGHLANPDAIPFQRCPEIRGIETQMPCVPPRILWFRRCPEVRGIESAVQFGQQEF